VEHFAWKAFIIGSTGHPAIVQFVRENVTAPAIALIDDLVLLDDRVGLGGLSRPWMPPVNKSKAVAFCFSGIVDRS
jgi:hypothetical protein